VWITLTLMGLLIVLQAASCWVYFKHDNRTTTTTTLRTHYRFGESRIDISTEITEGHPRDKRIRTRSAIVFFIAALSFFTAVIVTAGR
jgi:hypothetical protein